MAVLTQKVRTRIALASLSSLVVAVSSWNAKHSSIIDAKSKEREREKIMKLVGFNICEISMEDI